MSDNQYQVANTQGLFHVNYRFAIGYPAAPTGALGPVVGEGDPNGEFIQVQRGTSGIAGGTGTTGTTLVTTTDPFAGVIAPVASIAIAGQAAGTWTIEFGTPFQNTVSGVVGPTSNPSNSGQLNTWSIPFTVFSAGVATDPPVGATIFCHFTYRNGPQP
jgi:hypothetical protein